MHSWSHRIGLVVIGFSAAVAGIGCVRLGTDGEPKSAPEARQPPGQRDGSLTGAPDDGGRPAVEPASPAPNDAAAASVRSDTAASPATDAGPGAAPTDALAERALPLPMPAGPAPAPGDRPPTPGPSDNPYGAGLMEPLRWPDLPPGQALSVLASGATPDFPADDDGPAIGQALASARRGDVVVLPNGVYHVKTRRSIVLRSGVSLMGQTKDGAVLDAQFSSVKDNVGSYLIEAPPGTADVVVSNLTIRSTGGQELRYAVWLGHDPAPMPVSRIEVRDLVVTGFDKMAISVRNGTHIAIHRNVIADAVATGGGGEGYGVMIGYPGSFNNWVGHNELRGPALRHGVLLQYSAHHNLIEHNKASKLVMDSYDLHGEDEHSNELRANVAEGCGEGGFGVGNTGGSPEHYNAGPNNWIHHNQVTDCRYGIHIYRESHRTVVEHNVFTAIRDIGITIKNEGANECRVVGNRVDRSTAGSRFESARQLHMEGNVISGNSGYGMKLASSSTGYVIIGNDFRNNGGRVELATPDGRYEGNLE